MTDNERTVQEQLQLLEPIRAKFKQLYNSEIKCCSMWLTIQHGEETSQEIIEFPTPAAIPRHLKDYFTDYILFLEELHKSLNKQLRKKFKGERD